MEKFYIGQKQAQAFASAIFADIDAYVQAHQDEFEHFLKEEQTLEGGEKNESYAQTA